MEQTSGNLGRRAEAGLSLCLAFALLLTALAAASVAIYPIASGEKTYKSGGATLDVSHIAQGYVMARMKSAKKLKVRIAGNREYTYDLDGDGEYEVYPLQDGSRTYRVVVYEQVKGTRYSQVLSKSIDVRLSGDNAAFLVPNRYCWYEEDSEVVTVAAEICAELTSDREKADAVFRYVTDNICYDYMTAILAVSGQLSGYVPDLESVLERHMGICFDFASLMCAMLRSQGVPTRLVMGYADDKYHAWNSVLIDGEWIRYDAAATVTATGIASYAEEAIY